MISTIAKDRTNNSINQERKRDQDDSEEDSDSDEEVEESPSKKAKIFDFRKYGILNPQIGLKLNLDISKYL